MKFETAALRRQRGRRRPPPGSSPGDLHVDPNEKKPKIHVVAYGPEQAIDQPNVDLQSAVGLLDEFSVLWIGVEGLGDVELLKQIGERFQIHRLVLEDVAATNQRPKVEDYGEQIFIVVRAPTHEAGAVDTEQISLLLGKNFLLTFQQGDRVTCFNGVRERIAKRIGRIRIAGPDYLAYALVDSVVDAYFPTLEEFGERLDAVEHETLTMPNAATMGRIRTLRRDLLNVRRAVWPLRETIHSFLRDHTDRLQAETALHLRDSYDQCIELLDLIETYRDLAASLVDVYLSSVNNRMNEIIRVLTIVSTIFIPLSFIASVYGMNFKNMPELEWRYGYAAALGLMAVTGGGLLFCFWRRGWLRSLTAGV